MQKIQNAMRQTGWFQDAGAYVLVDGQYGSTGKGLLAGLIAETMGHNIDWVTTNAGPNSGHTAYHKGEKIVTLQLPVASVVMGRMGFNHTCYLNAGAVIDPAQVQKEKNDYIKDTGTLYLEHPNPAYIDNEDKGGKHSHISGTGKGVGPAMARKIDRNPMLTSNFDYNSPFFPIPDSAVVFVETAQGFSLGINSGFYPYVTSRECTVAQALADAAIAPNRLRKSIVTLRTFPIRVGNTEDGWSGPCYPDQQELDWAEDFPEIEPEITTVTKRVRRIFTWSRNQFKDCLRVNRPDALFINFLNYLDEGDEPQFLHNLRTDYHEVMKKNPDFILGGYGPLPTDIELLEDSRWLS